MKKKDIISPFFGNALFCFGIAAFLYFIELENSGGAIYLRVRARGAIIGGIIIGFLSLRNYVLNESGILCRWLFIPYRKIKWGEIEKIMIIPDNISHSILCIFHGCPKPDFSKNEEYSVKFASYNSNYTYRFYRAKKHIHLVEKYWPGEIENKYLLYQKKK